MIEQLWAWGAAILALLAGAGGLYGWGRSKGAAKEKEKAQLQRDAATTQRIETIKGAADVQSQVSKMPANAVVDELRNDWTRPGND